MDYSFCEKNNLKAYLEVYVKSKFYENLEPSLSNKPENSSIQKILNTITLLDISIIRLIDSLKDLCFLIEYPYTDKLYRDAYSGYFSTLNKQYSRNTIRVSIFTKRSIKVFEENKENDLLNLPNNKNYYGYFIIRPTYPAEYYRSFINPIAFKKNNCITCLCESSSLIEGKEYKTVGFPHSSQDGIVHSCSETAIWVLMEYFGSRYNYYSTTLPSHIHKILKKISFQRLIPSIGMDHRQIGYTLRKFGFGSISYSKSKYGDNFEFIINDYVESGIPIIAITQKSNKKRVHAFLIIGHSEPLNGIYSGNENYENKESYLKFSSKDKSIKYSVMDSMTFHEKDFIIMDDNRPPYRKAPLKNIGKYYGKSHDMSKDSEFLAIIVPLYPKIYLDALGARNLFKTVIKSEVYGWNYFQHSKLISRILLTSSRSFKRKIRNYNENYDLIKILLNQIMPKFIYICEISSPIFYEKKLCLGFMLFDSTSSRFDTIHSNLLAIVYPDRIFIKEGGILLPKTMEISPIPLYVNNLKKNDTFAQ